jgi:hypothetical protein
MVRFQVRIDRELVVEAVMLRTFKARLRGSHLEWMDDAPEMGEQTLEVYVTVLDGQPIAEPEARGQRMAEILGKLAATQALEDIDPVAWQQETRQDR